MRRSPVLALLLLAALGLVAAQPAAAAPEDVKVSEFRFRGPTGGNDEFVELVNVGTTRQSIAGFRVVGCSASGPTGIRATVPADRSIPPGGRYLFANDASGTGGQYPAALPRDQNYATGIADSGGVQITDPGGTLLDQVGAQASACREGTGLAVPTANGDNAFERALGVQDSDDNAADFQGPKPNNATACGPACDDTAVPGDQPPSVESTTPGNGATDVPVDANAEVTFSEPVDAGAEAFSLTCGVAPVPFSLSASEDGRTFTLDRAGPLPRDTQCVLTVRAAGVTDRDAEDPPDNPAADFAATFRTDASIAGLRIHDLQGRQHVSPYRGALAAQVPGVVTARRTNGFYFQDPQPDGDPRTSEGLFVFTGAAPDAALVPGTAITVSGQVQEFRPGGATSANLSTTQLARATVTPTGTGAIAPTRVGRGGRVPPREVVDDDTVDPGGEDPTAVSGDVEAKSGATPAEQDPTFDPDREGIDYYESLEGMRTEVRDALIVAPTVDFGSNREIGIVADRGADANVLATRGPLVVRGLDTTAPQEYRRGDFNPERILLGDANDPRGAFLPNADARDRFTEPVQAVVDYSFGNFKFLVVNQPARADGGLQPERTRERNREELAVASYNVENLDGADPQERFDRVAGQIVGNVRAPDILSLEEVQDNDGAASPAPTAADATFARLIEAIVRAGGPRYDFRQVDPAPNADGGEPNGNIRVAFLFRTDRPDLQFVDRPGATAMTPTEPRRGAGGRAELTLSPGRVDPADPVFANSRKPLAGEFRYRGRALFVVGSHFNSKGGDDPVFGRFQEPRRPSERQRRGSATDPADTTRGQAGVLNAFVRRLLEIEPGARVVVLGDFNDFDFSETVRVLEFGRSGGLPELNLWRLLPRAERYSYIFQGNAQNLDSILVSPGLALAGRPDLDAVHVNAEFVDQVSDHDPLVTRLRLGGGG